ncbi:hypothetical protein HB779_22490 (plasmid) [Phyllobacterium sp. 628]|uniref:hypothetical protein n=1 Tax=Phyllobacterium sp. 628 TaxID=2718938 RepID=UPI0016625E6F|nr:hypothetical protein [Phyllobacterium sp. 628]QND54661.1 hypothetical protein HB779_22490 [Phyllobacterium sp. 628]
MAIKFTTKEETSTGPAAAKKAEPAKREPAAVDLNADGDTSDKDLFNAAPKLPPRKRKGK